MRARAMFIALLGACLGACVGGNKGGLSREDQDKLKPYVLESVPDVAHVKDINFDDKVHIIGYRVEPESPAPGTEVKLTYYWRVDQPPGDGWLLFTHVVPEGGGPENLDAAGPLREPQATRKQTLGPDRWEKGKFYVDEQTYRVPTDGAASFTVYTGIWNESTGARMPIKNGPSDGDNRAEIVRVKKGTTNGTTATKAKDDVPEIRVPKLPKGESVTIDGKGDEKAWTYAVSTGPFGDVARGGPNTAFPVNAKAKLTWDDANVYVLFEVTDPDLIGIGDPKTAPTDFTATGQPKLWTKTTVEMMTDPDGDGDNNNYFELQISPQNKVFHSQFDTLGQPFGGGPNDTGPFGHEDWDPKLKSSVVVKGTIDKKDTDEGYTVELAVPWASFAKGAKQLPPRDSDSWRMNFYAMRNNGGVSWSPILNRGNFHFAPRFGRVTWVDPTTVKEAGTDAGLRVDAGAVQEAGTDGGQPGAQQDAGLYRPRPFMHRKPGLGLPIPHTLPQ